MSDAHGAMLALAVKLATKAGAGERLTVAEHLDSLSDEDRDRLTEADGMFYEGVEDCMAACQRFVEARKQEFTV